MGSATTERRGRHLAVTSIRIERDKLERFRAVAASHRRTVSQELNWLIDQAVKTSEAANDGRPA